MKITKKRPKKKLVIGAVGIISTALLISSAVLLNQENQKKDKIAAISKKVSDQSKPGTKDDSESKLSEDKKNVKQNDEKQKKSDLASQFSKNDPNNSSESKSKRAENKTSNNDLVFTKTPVKEDNSYSDVERPTLEDIINAPTKINTNSYFGSIDIDDLGIHTNTFRNLDRDTNNISMMQGVIGGLKNQKLGRSNYVLLGHNLGYSNVLFSDLPKAEKGMIIKVSERDVFKTFKVVNKKTVKNTDTTVFNMSKEPKLTLITCDKASATDKRVIITAELVD